MHSNLKEYCYSSIILLMTRLRKNIEGSIDSAPVRKDGLPVKICIHKSANGIFKAKMSEIASATAFMLNSLNDYPELKIDDAMLFDIRLALTEAFTNIIEHSYCHDPDQTISISITIEEEKIVIEFEDTGNRPDLSRLKWRDLNDYRERGLGLFLISRCMDSMTFCFGNDGVNRLKIIRFLDNSKSFKKSQTHLPFHVAVFEEADILKICLVGHLDRTRSNPFSEVKICDGVKKIVLDFSIFDFTDSFGLQAIFSFIRKARKMKLAVEVANATPYIEKLIKNSGFDILIKSKVEESDKEEMKLHNSLELPPGRYIPFVRSMGNIFLSSQGKSKNAECIFKSMLSRPLRSSNFDGKCFIRHANKSISLFARLIDVPIEVAVRYPSSLLFIGGFFSEDKKSSLASAHLYSALGSYSDFVSRGHVRHLIDFFRLLSSFLRDIVPIASSDNEEQTFLISACEIGTDGLRTYSGTGPMIGRFGEHKLRSIPLAGSENAIMEVSDTLLHLPLSKKNEPLRFLLGRLEDSDADALKEKSFDEICFRMNEMQDEEDKGIVDVVSRRK